LLALKKITPYLTKLTYLFDNERRKVARENSKKRSGGNIKGR
jgi:hypothetical protein